MMTGHAPEWIDPLAWTAERVSLRGPCRGSIQLVQEMEENGGARLEWKCLQIVLGDAVLDWLR